MATFIVDLQEVPFCSQSNDLFVFTVKQFGNSHVGHAFFVQLVDVKA